MLALAQGLGAEASPYKCNSTICYGADGGATHVLFKETQYQMNRAGQAIFGSSWSKVAVDGFLGEKTRVAYNRLAPKIAALVGAKYVDAPYFPNVAQWVSQSRPFIPTALKLAADKTSGMAESPAAAQVRQQAYAAEAPAKTGSTTQPNVTIPVPTGPTSTPTNQVPPTVVYPASASETSTGGKAFVWVTAGVAAIGLIATAVYVRRRRRR